MESHFFWAKLEAYIYFSDEEFETLWNASERHYDPTVQSLSKVCGLLYVENSVRNFNYSDELKSEDTFLESTNTIKLEFREVDLLIKSLEMEHSPKGYALSSRLHKIIREMRDKANEINQQFKQ